MQADVRNVNAHPNKTQHKIVSLLPSLSLSVRTSVERPPRQLRLDQVWAVLPVVVIYQLSILEAYVVLAMPLIDSKIIQNYHKTYEGNIYLSKFIPFREDSFLLVPNTHGNYYACTDFFKHLVNSFLTWNRLDISDKSVSVSKKNNMFMTDEYCNNRKPIVQTKWRCKDDLCDYSVNMQRTSPDCQEICLTNVTRKIRCHVLVHGILLAHTPGVASRDGRTGVSSKYTV